MLPIYFAERINDVCRANWERFAGQPYFDEHGFFISMMVRGARARRPAPAMTPTDD